VMSTWSTWHWGVLLTLLFLYLLPTFIAANRSHRQTAAITGLNILLGWTLLGWVAAFVWSLTSSQAQQIIYVREQKSTKE